MTGLGIYLQRVRFSHPRANLPAFPKAGFLWVARLRTNFIGTYCRPVLRYDGGMQEITTMNNNTKTTLKFLAAGLVAAAMVMMADTTLADVVNAVLSGN